MIQKILLGTFVVTVLLFNGCGGDNRKWGYADGVNRYDCSSEKAWNDCKGKKDCSGCTATPINGSQPETSNTAGACPVSGNTVLVDEGTKCTHGTSSVSCNGGKVTLDGSITAQTININGTTYICQ